MKVCGYFTSRTCIQARKYYMYCGRQ